MNRLVKVVRGKGLFADPTGDFEIDSVHGVIPHVIATNKPSCPMGFFFKDFPRVISVPRYRVIQDSSPARPDWAIGGYFGVSKLPLEAFLASMGPAQMGPESK